MPTTTERRSFLTAADEEFAHSHGWLSGPDMGYSTLDLWVNDSGTVHAYPAVKFGKLTGWVVATFSPGADVPYSYTVRNSGSFRDVIVSCK